MSARQRLATALTLVLPAGFQIIADVRDIGEWDPSNTAALQIITQKIAPESRMQAVSFECAIWVIVPGVDPEDTGALGSLEDQLDDAAEDLVNALLTMDNVHWSEGVRDMHPSGYHGFRFTTTVYSTITP